MTLVEVPMTAMQARWRSLATSQVGEHAVPALPGGEGAQISVHQDAAAIDGTVVKACEPSRVR